MNPSWLIAGILIGERLREPLRTLLRRSMRHRAYYAWVDSLPTTKRG